MKTEVSEQLQSVSKTQSCGRNISPWNQMLQYDGEGNS